MARSCGWGRRAFPGEYGSKVRKSVGVERRVRQKVGKREVLQEPEAYRAWETAERGQAAETQCPEKPLDPESQQRLKSGEEKNLPARKDLLWSKLFINSLNFQSVSHHSKISLFRELVIPVYILIKHGFQLKSLITVFGVLAI